MSGKELNPWHQRILKSDAFSFDQSTERYLKMRNMRSPNFDYKEVLKINKKYSDLIRDKYQP